MPSKPSRSAADLTRLRTIHPAIEPRARLAKKAIVFGSMLVATGLSKIFPFRNQLDRKQYEQMVAPEFVCSSALLKRELGWKPGASLDETLKRAVAGYRALGQL